MQEPVSPRQQIAINLADVCIFGSLNDSYGVIKSKQEDSRGRAYWSVSFCKAKILDGTIKVYGPSFILIEWQTAIRDMAAKGSIVCKSEIQAREFLTDNFIRRFL